MSDSDFQTSYSQHQSQMSDDKCSSCGSDITGCDGECLNCINQSLCDLCENNTWTTSCCQCQSEHICENCCYTCMYCYDNVCINCVSCGAGNGRLCNVCLAKHERRESHQFHEGICVYCDKKEGD